MNQIDIMKYKNRIDNMTQEDCARFWRFASSSDPIIQTPELYKYFEDRFKLLGGMTPEISKKIGL